MLATLDGGARIVQKNLTVDPALALHLLALLLNAGQWFAISSCQVPAMAELLNHGALIKLLFWGYGYMFDSSAQAKRG